jgi:hypothetical protein
MILLAWRLIPAKMYSRWNRETWNHRFISPAALCLGARVSSLLTPEAANRCQLPLQLRRQIYFASRTLSGSKSLFASDAGSANRCQRSLAAPSPDLFHQPHFVWEQNSAPLERRIGWTYK